MRNIKKYSMALFALTFFIIISSTKVSSLNEELNISSCTAAGCSLINYNSNDLNIGATVAQGATDEASWTNLISSGTIKDVILTFRHGGQTGISTNKNWGMSFQNETDSSEYCNFNTVVPHAVADTNVTINTTSACSWTEDKLDQLKLVLTNNDLAAAQNAYVYYMNLNVTLQGANNAPNATLNNPGNDTTISFANTVLLNVTYYDIDATPGTVTFVNATNNEVFCTNTTISDGSEVSCSVDVSSGSELKWYVNTTDGTDNTYNGVWNFTIQPGTISFSLSYPASGCNDGNGCIGGGCSACTYCSLNFTELPVSSLNCTGQTNAVSFFVVNNDGDLSIDIQAKLNETITNAFFKLGLNNDPFDAGIIVLTNSYQTITSSPISSLGTEEIWGF